MPKATAVSISICLTMVKITLRSCDLLAFGYMVRFYGTLFCQLSISVDILIKVLSFQV
jgi:hypothetical protein